MKTRLHAVAVIIALLGGCKGKDADWRPAQDQLERIADDMSKCTEKACGDEVHKRLEAWRADADAKHGKDATWPHDVQAIYVSVGKYEAKIVERNAVADMTKSRDTGCACKDAPCTKGVLLGAEAIKARAELSGVAPNTISDEDRAKIEDLYQQLVACSAKLSGSATP